MPHRPGGWRSGTRGAQPDPGGCAPLCTLVPPAPMPRPACLPECLTHSHPFLPMVPHMASLVTPAGFCRPCTDLLSSCVRLQGLAGPSVRFSHAAWPWAASLSPPRGPPLGECRSTCFSLHPGAPHGVWLMGVPEECLLNKRKTPRHMLFCVSSCMCH